tara:strand:+ start:435 stop:791 length:357 start_codon:yes stop_codon:yes gene_type:complete
MKMQNVVKEVARARYFDDQSFAQIGSKLGVTKQYLSFLCKKRKNQPEIVTRQLMLEFEKTKANYDKPRQLRIKRRLLGLTQAQVAKQIGTFGPVVTRIEKGQLTNSIFIQRMADYLDV